MEYQLTCPKPCASIVVVAQVASEGTPQRGGYGTIEARDVAKCTKCGREFTQVEIDDWARWV
jgi:hypothetical protein